MPVQPLCYIRIWFVCVILHCDFHRQMHQVMPGLLFSIYTRLAGPSSAPPLPSKGPIQPPDTKPGRRASFPCPSPSRGLSGHPNPVSRPQPEDQASRRAVPKLAAQARDLLRRPLRLGDGPLHGLCAQPELLARELPGAVGGVRGVPLLGRRYGGPLVDGRAPGRYYAVDDVPLRPGRPPARAYAHDVPRPQGVVWVVDQVPLEVLEVLSVGEEKGFG